MTSSKQKATRASELGLEYVFTYDRPTLVEDVMKASGRSGVDLVLDSVAGPNFDRNFTAKDDLLDVIATYCRRDVRIVSSP